jgi:hypothetical protein
MDLKDGMIVTINNKNYQVSNVSHTPLADTFDITETNLVASEWAVAANYETGSRKEIHDILNRDSGQLNRFPLIWLIPSIGLNHDNVVIDFEADVNLVFAHKSNRTDFTETRYNNNIDPVIQPLITLFNLWLQSSDFNYMLEFNGHGQPIDYDKDIFAFYGTSDKVKDVLTESTDAIEMSYNLQFKKQYEY